MWRGAGQGKMQSGWVRWIAYVFLVALVIVTSCQTMAGGAGLPLVQASLSEGARS
jgi:hypothetical protein